MGVAPTVSSDARWCRPSFVFKGSTILPPESLRGTYMRGRADGTPTPIRFGAAAGWPLKSACLIDGLYSTEARVVVCYIVKYNNGLRSAGQHACPGKSLCACGVREPQQFTGGRGPLCANPMETASKTET